MDRSEVAIVIPAFNEAAMIKRIVESVSVYGQPIVVDDCSVDETATLARIAGAVVVRHDTNRGYDGALNSGFAEADRRGCSYVVTFDADGQHSAVLVGDFLAQLEKGFDLVLGIRPRPARFAERIFGWFARIFFDIRDPLCGMKGYRMSIYRERGYFDSYRSIGTELALFAVRRGYPFAQIDVPIAQRLDSPRFGQRLRANTRIVMALFRGFLSR